MNTLLRTPIPTPQISSLAGIRVLVVGLGRFGGGVGVTQWLVRQGAVVTVTDQADANSLVDSLEAIAGLPITLCLGGHEACDLSQADLVVVNPAVIKNRSALFQEILRRKIPWTTEMNLFCERCPAPVVGVTGSFGKSTTCAMLAHVFEAMRQGGHAKFTGVHLGGNIGRSLLGDLPEVRMSDLVVLEMSNAQLEDIHRVAWEPAVAVITNLFPHHLDRYENFEGYIQAKLNLVRAGNGTCPVVFGEIDAQARPLLHEAVRGSVVRLNPVALLDWPVELSIPGAHNQANAACVMTVCHVMGLSDERVRDALKTFRGLPHRLEWVGSVRGVEYINDSKSTAPAATIIALDALREQKGKLIAIVGGQKKDVSLVDCAKALTQNCRTVICCGEAKSAFATALQMASTNPESIAYQVNGVAEAVAIAAKEARPGETVLFSPGAPSFDQYVNFTERGKHFAALVTAMGPTGPRSTH